MSSSVGDLHEWQLSIPVVVKHQESCAVFAELEIVYGNLSRDPRLSGSVGTMTM